MVGQQERFGDRLRLYREAAGFSQEQLAERTGLSSNAIGALERGERKRPYPDTIRRLAEALGLSDEARSQLAASSRERVERAPAPSAESGAESQGAVELPGEPTPLIGRERESEVVRHLFEHLDGRLLTLTGPGGVGKTRLALHLAHEVADRFPDGVAWVELAPLVDPALVLPTIARALNVKEPPGHDFREALRNWLRGRRLLLVVDNVEHLLDAATDIADLMLACPDLHVVATSRAPLNVRGEQEYVVPPLELPLAGAVGDRDQVAAASSVRLFVWHARQKQPTFALTEENAAIVAAICRRLDGLPLALELVAARVRALSPAELLTRLDRLMPLLVGGSRDLPRRQQTMRAAINWSYELLSPGEQALFRRLSVFAGGWSLEAAEAVTPWSEVASEHVLDLLSRLVEQSLVAVMESSDGGSRYWMLEPIRQFAAQCIDEAGEMPVLFEHHFAWCLSLAQEASQGLTGPNQRQLLDRLEQEHDNLRVALSWSLGDGRQRSRGLELATALWRFWATRGHFTEGRQWLESALAPADEDVPPRLRAEGLNAVGNLAVDQGDLALGIDLHTESLELRRQFGDRDGMARSLNDLGNIMLNQGRYQRALPLYEEALSLFRSVGAEWGSALVLNNMAIALGFLGEYERAGSLLDEALVLWEGLGDVAQRARSLDARGVIAREQGELNRSAALHQASLALRREIGDTRGIAVSLNNYGLVARACGDDVEATRLLEESLRLRRMIGDKLGVANSLTALAHVTSDIRQAESIYREAIELQRQMDSREKLVECLIGLAGIAGAEGRLAQAARMLGKIEALRQEDAHAISTIDQDNLDRAIEAVRNQLRDTVFDVARAAGRSMTVDAILGGEVGDNERERGYVVRLESPPQTASPIQQSGPASAGVV